MTNKIELSQDLALNIAAYMEGSASSTVQLWRAKLLEALAAPVVERQGAPKRMTYTRAGELSDYPMTYMNAYDAGLEAGLAARPPAERAQVAEIVEFGFGLKEISWAGGKMPEVGTKLFICPELPSIMDLSYDLAQKVECELPDVRLPGGRVITGHRFPAVGAVPERSPGDQIAALMMIDGIGEARARAIYRRGFRLMPPTETASPVVPQPILVEAVAVTRECEEDGLRIEWTLEGGIAALELPGTVLLVAHGTVTNDEGHGYVIPVEGGSDE